MGTWNWGPFDNDAAKDAVGQLADGTFRMDQFRFECDNASVDSEQGQVIVALAAVINGHLPCESLERARAFDFSFRDRRWIEAKVREAVVVDGSELYGMWEDAGELQQWLAATREATSKVAQ